VDPVLAGAFIDCSRSQVYYSKRILGRRLKKFCLWHQFLLKTIDSPFMSGKPVTMRDLRIAVGICSLSPFDSDNRKPWLVPTLLRLKALFAPRSRRKRPAAPSDGTEGLNPWQRVLRRKTDAFLEYCGDYLQEPEYSVIPMKLSKSSTPDTRRGRLDECIEHAGELITWGIPEQRAWSMPMGMANVYRIIARRAAGMDIDVITEEEREFMNQLPPEYRRAS